MNYNKSEQYYLQKKKERKKKKKIKARISSEIFLSLARPSAVYPQKYTMY